MEMNSLSRRLLQFLVLLLAGAGCLAAQSKSPLQLGPGKILVASRSVTDPLFKQSVILLVRYGASGALGLMINRRSKVPISDVLAGVKGAAADSHPVFVGGPVELRTVFALARSPRKPKGATAVSGDIYFLGSKTALETALDGGSDPSRLRIYVGYCGWQPRQLEHEVLDGGWYIFNSRQDLAFDAKPSSLWLRLFGRTEQQIARRSNVSPGHRASARPKVSR
jgi:putative transcriptional regulator